jgi:hypothetical protein
MCKHCDKVKVEKVKDEHDFCRKWNEIRNEFPVEDNSIIYEPSFNCNEDEEQHVCLCPLCGDWICGDCI